MRSPWWISIELRVPFVDRKFFPVAVAATACRTGYLGKLVLAESLKSEWLQALTRRPKKGFSVPIKAWTQNGVLTPFLREATQVAAPLWDVVDRERALPLLTSVVIHPNEVPKQWALVVLNAWIESVQRAGST